MGNDVIQPRTFATEGIPDQRLFALDDEDYESLLAMLDAATEPPLALRARMNRKPVWDK
jgi:uncharacterized protein (DUF1778 family)